ncbi:MAG: alpha/beta fold hydrolase, partial [candidate division KSB1 bacterium]
MHNKFILWLIFVLGLSFPQSSFSQTHPYPIIFIHGINSEDETWKTTIHYFRDRFGWNDPYHDAQDPNGQGIFHAVLDTSALFTRRGLDVVFDFPNEHNDLYNGNLYAINFHNWWNATTGELLPRQNRSLTTNSNFSESNEAAITKQGYALGEMIRKVLAATGAQKVVLVGHSMGGLAAREYLQRREANG